jgi:phosphoglycolate phosphatase-like HAD superfamily hydrolase
MARYLLLYDAAGVLIRETDTGEKTRTAGSWEAMSQLSGRTDAAQAVLTELTRDDAAELLKEVTGLGLDRYLDIEIGGYGSADLASLVPQAKAAAAAKHDAEFVTVAVAGPASVAALAGVADVVVAVSTSDEDELRAAGAKHVVKGFLELVPLVVENRVA